MPGQGQEKEGEVEKGQEKGRWRRGGGEEEVEKRRWRRGVDRLHGCARKTECGRCSHGQSVPSASKKQLLPREGKS